MNARSIKAASRRLKAELSAMLSPLARVCPAGQGNPDDCPLYRLRKMKSASRKHWLDALGKDDLVYLANYHHVCLFTKLEMSPTERPID